MSTGELKAGNKLFSLRVEDGDSVGEIFNASDPDGTVFILVYNFGINGEAYGESTLHFQNSKGGVLANVATYDMDGIIVQKIGNTLLFFEFSNGLHAEASITDSVAAVYTNDSSAEAFLTARMFTIA